MNHKYSLGLSVAMLLLLISGSGTLPVSSLSGSFSVPSDNATTGDIVAFDQNGSPQTTSSHDKRLSSTDKLNAFSPPSENTEAQPLASEGSGDGSSGSSDITSVSDVSDISDGSDSDNNLDTSTYEDGSTTTDTNSAITASAEAGLNSSSSSSSSGNGASAPVDVSAVGQSSGSSTNDSSTENNQSPNEETSGVTPSDGTSGSLPSNTTEVELGGSTTSSGESALNQSSVESSSSANQSGITHTNTAINGSSTGLSPSHGLSNETDNVASGPLANDNQLQPASEDSEISVTSASDPNAVEQDILAGDDQHVSYGDISNQNNVTSVDISLDKDTYTLEDSPKVTIADGEANVDSNAVNTIQTRINSTSDETGIPITLTETGPNTGVFEGIFSFTTQPSSAEAAAIQVASGDDIGINYTGTHPRMSADIDGVVQGGTITTRETIITDPSAPAGLIGGAVELTFSDQVVLGPNELTGPDCPEGSCLGKTTVTLSYANAPLGAQIPEAFTVWQFVPGVGQWLNLRDFQPSGSTVQVDTDGQTVTAYSPFKGGIFSIGIDNPGSGGGGGGIGFPGAGIVLDLIAPITSTPPPSPPPSTPPPVTEQPAIITPELTATEEDETSATDQATDPSLIATNSTSSTTGGQSTDAATASTAGAGSTTNKAQRSGSDTIFIPGEGNITISFENLVSGENLMASALKATSDLASLNITKGTNQIGKLMALDNTLYDVVGTVFVIGPYDARLNGTTTVTIPYDANLTAVDSGAAIRMLHFTGSSWEDVTATPPADGHFVTGTLSTLGPVVAAVKSQ